jgi:hypothetical protein
LNSAVIRAELLASEVTLIIEALSEKAERLDSKPEKTHEEEKFALRLYALAGRLDDLR